MAFKVTALGSEKNVPTQQMGAASRIGSIGLTKPLETLLGGVGSLGQGIVNLLDIPARKISGAPAGYTPRLPLPTIETIQENITKPLSEKVFGGYAEPQGFGEETLGRIAETIPLLPFLGGSLAANLGRAGLSALGSQTAKSAGLGLPGEIAGGVLGGSLLDTFKRSGGAGLGTAFAKKIKSEGLEKAFKDFDIGGIKTVARKEMTNAYNAAEKALESPKIKRLAASNLESHIEKEIKKLPKSGLTKEQQKEIASQLKTIAGDIQLGKIDIKNAWDSKKHINSLIGETPTSKMRNIYKRTVGALNEDVLSKAAKEYPKFGKPYLMAEDYFKSLDAPNALRDVLEEHTSLRNLVKNPIAQIGAFGSTQYFGPGKTALGFGGALGLRTLLRATDFASSPQARKLIGTILKEAQSGSVGPLAHSLRKYDKLADSFEKKQPKAKFTLTKKS